MSPVTPSSGRHLPAAILLDLDGTLLVNSSAHLAVLAATLSRHARTRITIDLDGERPRLDGRDVSGWIDAQLVRFALEEHSRSLVPASEVREVMEEYGSAFLGAIGAGAPAGQQVARAEDALDELRAAGVKLALVTGNAVGVARAKLESVGLDRFFLFDRDLGFGDWRQDRVAVARAALDALGLEGPGRSPPADVVLVGDTAWDMRAASQVGVRPFGVMTGAGGLTELVDAGAEKVLGSVGDLLGEGNYA